MWDWDLDGGASADQLHTLVLGDSGVARVWDSLGVILKAGSWLLSRNIIALELGLGLHARVCFVFLNNSRAAGHFVDGHVDAVLFLSAFGALVFETGGPILQASIGDGFILILANLLEGLSFAFLLLSAEKGGCAGDLLWLLYFKTLLNKLVPGAIVRLLSGLELVPFASDWARNIFAHFLLNLLRAGHFNLVDSLAGAEFGHLNTDHIADGVSDGPWAHLGGSADDLAGANLGH